MIFGRRISKHYRGKLQTEIEDIDLPSPVIRSHYGNGFVKQYVLDHLMLRTEAASNNVNDYGVNKSIENLPVLRDALGRSPATTRPDACPRAVRPHRRRISKSDRSSIASINVSSMISMPSFAPSASKSHDKGAKREQNPRYSHYNGLNTVPRW